MFGQIKLAEFKGLTTMPQKAASAWSAFETSGLVGASYKPLLYVGEQAVKGINYWFICEETLITREPERHLVALAINEFGDEYELVPGSIERFF